MEDQEVQRYNCRENMKIGALSSSFWQQIADLNQLFGLEETKMDMYIITLLSNVTFGTIGKATVVDMTAKAVGKNSSLGVSMRIIWTWGHAAKHVCEILNNFLLTIRFLRLSLKCYCDENFVFSFPVFLSVISYLDPKFHESAKFFTI